MSAAGPPQGTRPLGGAARSDVRGDHSAAGPPQGTGPLGGAAPSDVRGDHSAAGPPQGTGPLGGAARSDVRGDPTNAALDAPFSVRNGNDEISTARPRLDVDVIHGFLTASYWAADIPRATVARSLAGSLNFGLYRDGTLIGFARFVTDAATFAYLADVFVLPDYRSQGLATWLVGTALTHPALTGLRRVLLATRDAHALYAKFGFAPLARPDRFMEILKLDVYSHSGG